MTCRKQGLRQPRTAHGGGAATPILLIGLVVLIALAAGHLVFPVLWLGFLVAILLFATGTIGRSRSSQRR